jgi:two-component system cell cycle sensor histidine kinase/response regulator CckA
MVEDEEALLTALQSNLERCGYVVLTAESPAQGLAVAAAHAGRIDLLLTDMTTPGGSGRGLAERLVAVRPELRVLFMSGSTEDLARRAGAIRGAFIAKPFVFDELVRRIERLLADRSPAMTPAEATIAG